MADGSGDNHGANNGGNNGGGDNTPAPWHTDKALNLDQETVGFITTRGWDKLSAGAATAAAIKSYREAAKHVGAPPEELVRLPKDANAPEWNGVYTRLGRPEKAEGYDFSAIKFGDGSELDPEFVTNFRNEAFAANLSKDAANRTLTSLVKFLDGVDANERATTEAALNEERAKLNKDWGPNKDANKLVAQNAVRALGLDPEIINVLEGVVGYAKVMEAMRQVGVKLGEDKFVRNDSNRNAVMTRGEAASRKASLMADNEWSKRYLNGGVKEREEMTALNRIISGVAA